MKVITRTPLRTGHSPTIHSIGFMEFGKLNSVEIAQQTKFLSEMFNLT